MVIFYKKIGKIVEEYKRKGSNDSYYTCVIDVRLKETYFKRY